jgi:hypothetical protein
MPQSYKATVQNIIDVQEGDIFYREINLTGLDVTGFSGKAQVREEAGKPILLSFSTDDGTMTCNGSQITLLCESDKMILTKGIYKYDLQIYTTIHDVTTIMRGNFEVGIDGEQITV